MTRFLTNSVRPLLASATSHDIAKGTLVIQQETDAIVTLDDSCLVPEAAREFKDP